GYILGRNSGPATESVASTHKEKAVIVPSPARDANPPAADPPAQSAAPEAKQESKKAEAPKQHPPKAKTAKVEKPKPEPPKVEPKPDPKKEAKAAKPSSNFGEPSAGTYL